MKKLILISFIFQALFFLTNSAQILQTSFTSEEGWSTQSYDNWEKSIGDQVWKGNSINISGSNKKEFGYGIGFNDVGDWLELPEVNYPGVLRFYARLSSNGDEANNKLAVQVYDVNEWVTIKEFSQSVNTFEQFAAEININLQGVKLRIYRTADQRSHYVDELTLTSMEKEPDKPDRMYSSVIHMQNHAPFLTSDTIQSSHTGIFQLNLFNLQINDVGDDEKDTYPRQFYFSAGPSNTINFDEFITKLHIEEDGNIVNLEIIEKAATFVRAALPDSGQGIIIPNGQSSSFNVIVSLFLPNYSDSDTLQMQVQGNDHKCIADTSGTGFSDTFPESPMISEAYRFNVSATQIRFLQMPDSVTINQPFSVEIMATNENGQIDLDFESELSLHVESGIGVLLIPASDTLFFNNGRCIINGLAYDKTGNFTLFAQAGQFSSGESDVISSAGEQATEVRTVIQSEDTITITSGKLTNSKSVDIMHLRLRESISSDNLPTVVRKIVLQYNYLTPEKEDLLPPIQSFYIFKNGDTLWASNIEYENSKIIAEFENTMPVVKNGDSAEVTLGIKVQPKMITDKGLLKIHVPKENHNWETIENSSQFHPEFSTDLKPPPILFEVFADSLMCSGNALLLQKNKLGDLQFMATDIYGTRDFDFSGPSTITQVFGKEAAEMQNSITFTKGMSTQIHPIFNSSGQYILKVNAGEKIGGQTDTIFIADTLTSLIHADFENNDLKNWELFSEWKVSGSLPIGGGHSLKHSLISQAGSSMAFCNFDSINADTVMLLWKFSIQATDWEPSSSNYFRVWLSDIIPENKDITVQGYAIEFYDGELVFSKRSSNGSSTRLIYSGREIEPNEILQCQVLRRPGGSWKVYLNQSGQTDEGTFYKLAGSAVDNQFKNFKTSGIHFVYTKTRAGKFRVDEYTLVTAPDPVRIILAEQINDSLIDITFSDGLSALPEQIYLFKIDDGVQTEQNLKQIPELDTNSAVLHLTITGIKGGKYNIICSGLTGLHTGRREEAAISVFIEEMKKDTVLPGPNDSTFTSNIQMNDIIFTEIMFDPSPQVSLPDVEYVEIYNRTDSAISLLGSYLIAGDKKIRLPYRIIEPGQYLVICDDDAKLIFTKFADALTLPSFPALLNTGAVLQLRDAWGQLITAIHYDESFHDAHFKKAGGWSIERKSIHSELATKENWQSSVALIGGTPGKENSVANSVKDTLNPEIEQYYLKNDSTLSVQFSEPITNDSFDKKGAFSFTDEAIISSIQRDSIFNDILEIKLEGHFNQGEKYSLSIKGLQDWAGNEIKQNSFDILLPYPIKKGDIIINEVLFHPVSTGVEFVELLNISDNSFDLSTISIAKSDYPDRLELKPAIITQEPVLFESKAYIVLTESCDELWKNHPNTKLESCIDVPNFPRLNNKEGSILLLNSSSEAIDMFTYNENMHYQLLTEAQGVSLERINPQIPTQEESNWHSASYLESYATPGFQNSQFMNNTMPNDYFNLEPEVFSPDNDGYHDLLFITYKMDKPGYSALVRIYSPRGRLVKELLSNQLLETEGSLNWDGFSADNVKAAPGIYIVYIQLYTPQGGTKYFKKTCVLAKRFD